MTKEKLRKKLNLNYLTLTNKTHRVGELDFPEIMCPYIVEPDYLALYSEKRNYHKTALTAICFYQFDDEFDQLNGLFNAIYYNNKKLLKEFKKRFRNCKLFILPDYSQCGDIELIERLYRQFKTRIVALWLTISLNAIAIPNISYGCESDFKYMLQGFEKCEVVAFSIKGSLRNREERELLINAIKYVVDNLPLKLIVVYSVCKKDEDALKFFEYAIAKNIKVIIPDNILKQRNIERSDKKNGKKS